MMEAPVGDQFPDAWRMLHEQMKDISSELKLQGKQIASIDTTVQELKRRADDHSDDSTSMRRDIVQLMQAESTRQIELDNARGGWASLISTLALLVSIITAVTAIAAVWG